jgi:peptidoglycan hydrolase-like protein with peptidoglycan-binding domain
MNEEGHPIYYPKGAKDTLDRISWNKARNYTKDYIKAFQRLIQTNDDGDFGTNTVNAIRHYQEKNKLPSKDGKWGKECADASGLARKYNGGGSSNTSSGGASSGGGAAPSGLHLNPAPSFDKQYNYKTQPYVSQKHYNEMKEKMGSTPYAQWDVSDSRISGIYAKAKALNKDASDPEGKSTIKSSGCGISAYANLKGISPTESAVMSMEGNHRKYQGGTAPSFFTSKGVKELKSMTAALNEVKDGKYVIYSRGGHFLLLYGYDDKNLYLSDSYNSNSPKKSPRTGHKDSKFAHGYSFDK